MSSGRRIVLGEDDFKDPEPPSPPAAPPVSDPGPAPAPAPGFALPPVARHAPLHVGGGTAAQIHTPGVSQTSLLNDPRAAALIPALVGMLLAWGVTELTNLPHLASRATSKTGLDAYIGVWTAVLEIVFVAVIVGFDRAVSGAWEEAGRRALRSIIPSAIAGFVAGFCAQAVYTQMIESAFRSGDFSPGSARLYLARALGWAIFGLGAGVVLGVIERSPKKAINGAIGGLVGGAVGGLVFQFTSLHLSSSERLARLLGLLAISALVALATQAVETVRREAWLRVVAGGMTGKEFILYHAVTRIGSSPQCEIFLLKDPAVEPLHAQIEDRTTQRILTASPAAPVLVNGSPATSHVLRDGETLQIGTTVMSYSERAAAAPTPTTDARYR